MIALRPLPLLMMACLLFPVVPAMAQPAGASAGDGATISDRVASWAAQMKAEAEALRSEGADEAVTTLGNLLQSETALLERLRAAPNVDAMLPEIGRHWADGASSLNGLAARMPAIIAAHRRRLQALQGLLVQAQGASRSLSRESDAMRGDLEAARARARGAVDGSTDAMKADLQAAALAATLAAREAQARLAAGFATQAGQALRRLDDASAGLDLLATAIAAHGQVLQASADLARTRVVARDALQLLADMADRLEGIEGVLQGLAQSWDSLDGLLGRLGDLPALSGKAGS